MDTPRLKLNAIYYTELAKTKIFVREERSDSLHIFDYVVIG